MSKGCKQWLLSKAIHLWCHVMQKNSNTFSRLRAVYFCADSEFPLYVTFHCSDLFSVVLFVCRRATMEKASATVPSLSVSSWSSGSKGSSSMSPPSTSKGQNSGNFQCKNTLLHLLTSSWHAAFSVSSIESRQICTTLLRGHTLLSWPSTERSRPISTRLRSFWRKRFLLQSNSVGRFYDT